MGFLASTQGKLIIGKFDLIIWNKINYKKSKNSWNIRLHAFFLYLESFQPNYKKKLPIVNKFGVNCIKFDICVLHYLVVMSLSRAGLSHTLSCSIFSSARDLFPSARNFYFSLKIKKIAFFATLIFFLISLVICPLYFQFSV